MKAIIEVDFSIDEGYGFPREAVEKALFENLNIRAIPMVERTVQGNLTLRINDLRVVEFRKE